MEMLWGFDKRRILLEALFSGPYSKSDSKKVLVSSIISAASRKVNKSRQRRSGDDFECDWSSRAVERSRDGGERLDNETESDRLSSSVDGSTPSTGASSKTNSSGSVHNSSNNNSVKLRKDRARSSLESKISLEKERLDDPRTSLPTTGSGSDSVLCSTSSPDIVGKSYRPISSRPSSTFEGPMHSYKDWKANTQERIKRFEEETRAMLERDPTKHMKPSSKLDITKQSLDEALGKAKEELESYDIYDYIADNPSGRSFFSTLKVSFQLINASLWP